MESEGGIAFRHRGAAPPVATLAEEDLVDRPNAATTLTLTRGQETELPAVAKLAYVGAGADYSQAIAEARRRKGGSGRVSQADLAIVLETELADAVAETWLFEAWAARERASLVLPPSRLAVEPGDLFSITGATRQRLYRITDVSERGERVVEALGIDPSIYTLVTGSGRSPQVAPARAAGQPLVELLDLPLLRGDESERAVYAAAAQSPWPGGIAFYSSPETTGFELRAIATAPATMGATTTVLTTGPTSRIDWASKLVVKLDNGEVSSATRLQLFGGANTAAIRNADGGWEIVQFATASLLAPMTYELSGLLRGQAGSQLEMRSSLPAGARFVLLDQTLARIDLRADEVGLALNWRFGPVGRNLGEESFAQRSQIFRGVGQRPWAPAHVKGHRIGDDLAIAWTRRTRAGGDPWDPVEVPLSEEAERYELEILDGASVKRTFSIVSPAVSYSAAQQIADFGGPQSSVRVRVYQVNSAWGRGSAIEAIV